MNLGLILIYYLFIGILIAPLILKHRAKQKIVFIKQEKIIWLVLKWPYYYIEYLKS